MDKEIERIEASALMNNVAFIRSVSELKEFYVSQIIANPMDCLVANISLKVLDHLVSDIEQRMNSSLS